MHATGLTSPLLYDMNRKLRVRRGDEERPHPRQLEDLMQKMFPTDPTGTVRIAPIMQRTDDIDQTRKNGTKIGVVATNARRWAMDRGLEVDYRFNAIAEMTDGREIILVVDEPLVGLVQKRLETFRRARG